jgi:enoyl-CoA hydratase/carnithine racemase
MIRTAVDATEARRMGLVSRVTEDPRAVALEIAANDAEAVRAIAARLRDDAAPERREAREAAAFA